MKALSCLGTVLLFLLASARAEDKWAIHEWGTFTSLQNENGEAIGGINTDDEPVPPFVHRLTSLLLLRPNQTPNNFFQGAPSCHPDVTMRLETPVIYFHPPKAVTQIENATVRVLFRGGWLTEFYPYATPDAPGIKEGTFQFPHLLSSTESKLEWTDLKIGGNWPLTNTSAHVWTSPRAVQAASVRTGIESEKFLFYRGVAHIDAPLKISRDTNSGELLFRSQLGDLPMNKPLTLRSLWLVDIRKDGNVAFRTLPSVSLDHNANKVVAHTAAEFESKDFGKGNLEKLKNSLKTALVTDGLFSDEADALLNTWELSYFKSVGLRVFFLVPRYWTDFYLPLEISLPADINRVMVGRIELITPEQRHELEELSSFSVSDIQKGAGQLWTNYFGKLSSGGTNQPTTRQIQEWNRMGAELESGKTPLSAFVSVPKSYQTYLDLGRFRNALVLDEAQRRPTEGLTNLISTYRLEASIPVDNPTPSAN